MHFKEGVDHSDMSEHITRHYETIDETFRERTGHDATITSARDGEHMEGSRHDSGEAIDLRTRDMDRETAEQITRDLQQELGRDYDVEIEKNHIHVEYDPEK